MNKIGSKIQFVIVVSILIVACSAVVLLFVNQRNALKNRQLVETMTTENSIITLSTELIATYNDTVKNTDNPEFGRKYLDLRNQIDQAIALLKVRITSPESKILLVGVENTVKRVIAETDEGLSHFENNRFAETSDHFVDASKYNEFVRDNVRTLLQKELEYLASTQAESQRIYTTGLMVSVGTFTFIIILMLLVSRSFARQLTDPIVRLSQFAKKIAEGDLNAKDEMSKSVNPDEVGSLTVSVHTMVEKLLSTMRGVEQKVEERTKELSDEKSKLMASISALPRAFLIVDHDIHIVAHNDKLESIFGEQNESWSVELIDKLLGTSFDLKQKIEEVLSSKKVFDIPEFQYGAKFLRVYMAPVVNSEGVLIGAVVTIKDATEARVLARSKDEFFSIASHELRTPLTAIRGNTSMMLEYYKDAFKDPELKQMMDDTHDASVRLIGIVNDFLDMSRLEMGKVEFKLVKTDLPKLITETLKEYMVTGSQQKLSLELVPPSDPIPEVVVDADRLRQVIINLVGNGIKFTKVGGIKIEIQVKEKIVEILVTDTGTGIPLANQGLLFHKFQQAGSSLATRDTSKGTGLGLYISRLLIEGMGGKLELVKSEEGKGSTFGISLPLTS